MSMFVIEPFKSEHQPWAEESMRQSWGSTLMVSRGILYQVLDYPGFVATLDGRPRVLATYHIDDDQCEVLVLFSEEEGLGMSSGLIQQIRQVAQQAHCKRLWLITTNDNIHAIRWYQKRGFTFAAIHINALEESRKLKPQIPMIGNDGIPLRDEIEFEMHLT